MGQAETGSLRILNSGYRYNSSVMSCDDIRIDFIFFYTLNMRLHMSCLKISWSLSSETSWNKQNNMNLSEEWKLHFSQLVEVFWPAFILLLFCLGPWDYNWNKIHNFLWIWSALCKIMISCFLAQIWRNSWNLRFLAFFE